MFDKKVRIKIRSFHRWMGVVAGVQLSLWIISGLYFAWVPIGEIKGESKKIKVDPSLVNLSELKAPAELRLPDNFQVKSLKTDQGPKGLFYRLESADERLLTFFASTGAEVPLLSLDEAKTIGLSQVKINSSAIDAQLISERGGEYKGPVPAYRVQLDDVFATRLYLDPWTGKLIVQRNTLWRVYDFLWMLHIMDYSEREDFNNPWIKASSVAGLIIITTGYLLFYFGVIAPRRRF